ncbi:MAG TPA: type I DNA topoisomerase [Candidatus Saccharimonadales bacterium]|nr:type I DNA topoisomerase [Candidatus Saccharimonadales bacterium]
MSKNVVVVESPAKANTIEKFLGKGYSVLASYGHVRDLPKSKLGIDVEHNFEPEYIIPRGSGKTVKALKTALAAADTIYLATDYDREGEAIAWHILQAIPPTGKQKVNRITFTEITEPAIKAAITNPRDIDQDLVDAQQARRVLDRLVGYSLSPVLWKKVRSGLSAGRVQSVALKLIVDREREIEAFKPAEYWSLIAELETTKGERLNAELTKVGGKKPEVTSEKAAKELESKLKEANFVVESIDSKEVKRSPAPPFITSSLQQEASRKLSFSSRKTMMVAQQLYEGINLAGQHVGLISYMRTDSFNLSTEATTQAKQLIEKLYGKPYATQAPRAYKKKVRGAQEAHEAIRPTDLSRQPGDLAQHLTKDQLRLYQLIWQRTMASQISDAKYLQKGANIAAADCILRAKGRETLFDGFTRVYTESRDDGEDENDAALSELTKDEKLKLVELLPEQHFTSPPPRYTEASLIKVLEENGIGRPSTYAPTMGTIINRGYVRLENRQFHPQDVGYLVTDLLTKHFPFVVNEQFTADVEDKLDDIAEGQKEWKPFIKDFYGPMRELIDTETDKIPRMKIPEIPTDEKCEVCGKPMVIKSGRFGQFMACTGFPECKNTKPYHQPTGIICPEDGGDVIERKTKRGRTFWGCANYPECKFASWTKPGATSEPAEAAKTADTTT